MPARYAAIFQMQCVARVGGASSHDFFPSGIMDFLPLISRSFVKAMGSVCLAGLFLSAGGGLVSAAPAASADFCVYRETTGTAVKDFRWSRASSAGEEVVTVDEEGAAFVNRCDRAGRTLAWQYDEGKQTAIRIVRDGNLLLISGLLKGKRVDATQPVDDRPWYQPLSFSLRAFLDSPAATVSFWMVRTDSLEAVTMQARKCGVEEVGVAGGRMRATRVEIRREGLLSSFWHATFWFREGDHLFVRYQGVHGPPGTRETLVQLMKER